MVFYAQTHTHTHIDNKSNLFIFSFQTQLDTVSLSSNLFQERKRKSEVLPSAWSKKSLFILSEGENKPPALGNKKRTDEQIQSTSLTDPFCDRISR